MKNANASDTKRIAESIAGVTLDSLSEHQEIANGTGAEKWIAPSDYLYLYRDRSAFEADSFGWNIRAAHGLKWQELEDDAFKDYDPVFSPDIGFAVCMPDHGCITDPGQYVKDLAAHVERQGGGIIKAEAEDIVIENGNVTGVRASGETITCDDAVIATGVWSGPLARKLGVNVPLESERGYHVELWDPSFMPKTPVMIASGKFVATPMDGRLRLAGVVELGGLDAPPSREPFDLLLRHALAAMPGLTWARKTEWMGHRPATADSIPVIGAIPNAKGAYTAFGHHHIGLTAGPKTGRMLSQIITGANPNLDLSAYSPARFMR